MHPHHQIATYDFLFLLLFFLQKGKQNGMVQEQDLFDFHLVIIFDKYLPKEWDFFKHNIHFV